MQNIIEIKHLSREEKLMAMEAIWEDLLNEEEQIESPGWHKTMLQETEGRFSSGQERILDWPDAKKELRKRLLKSG